MDASAATLLNMLNISPFTYGLIVQQVYDSGTVFEPMILDIKPEALRTRFMEVYDQFHSKDWLLFMMKIRARLQGAFRSRNGRTLWRSGEKRLIAHWAV